MKQFEEKDLSANCDTHLKSGSRVVSPLQHEDYHATELAVKSGIQTQGCHRQNHDA